MEVYCWTVQVVLPPAQVCERKKTIEFTVRTFYEYLVLRL